MKEVAPKLSDQPNPSKRESLESGVSAEMDRHNGFIFLLCFSLLYFVAPVAAVDVVQAGLCTKLGASAVIANLPASAYLLGCFVPIFISRMIPPRLERTALVGACLATSVSLGSVCILMLLPVANSVRIGVLIAQGSVAGLASSVFNVYFYQCLGRGTSGPGRAKAFKLAFTWSPVAAIIGSLGAQFVLGHRIPSLVFPFDFAVVYFIGAIGAAALAFAASRFELMPINGRRETQPLVRYMIETAKSFFGVRRLALLWIAYVLWYLVLTAMPTMSLFTRMTVGKEPAALSFLIMAIRYAGKSVGGFVLGAIMVRYGFRAPLAACVALVGLGVLWTWGVPGYAFLIAFAFMGAGELGGAYFSNYVVSESGPENGARNMSVLMLATPVVSIGPIIYGSLNQHYGYPASFAFGILVALPALWIVLTLPARHQDEGRA